jgi:type IV secretion system protein TrbL
MAESAFAQTVLQDASGSISGLVELIKNSAAQWDSKLEGYAIRLFWILAVIQLVWTFFPLVMRQADFGEIIGELIRFIMVIGFFAALLTNATTWAEAIVTSFRQAGATAAGVGPQLHPGDMFGLAVEMADTIGDVQTLNPLTAFMVALSGAIVLLCFTFIAAFMALTLVESYIVINASVLFMGFGGSQWTREYAIAMLRYAVSVGAKLFVLTLIVGLIMQSAKQWQAAYSHDDASMWTMVGLALVCAYLSKTVPELIQGLITGVSVSGGSMIGGMAAAGVAGATAAIATIGASKAAEQTPGENTGKGLSSLINSAFGSNAGASQTQGMGSSLKANLDNSVGMTRTGGGAMPPPTSAPKEKTGQGTGSIIGGSRGKAARVARTAVSESMIGATTLSAISVPGMESTAGMSIGAGLPPAPSFDDPGSEGSTFSQSENAIRPDIGDAPSENAIRPDIGDAPKATPPVSESSKDRQ